MSERSSESDFLVENSDSDPDFIPGTDSDDVHSNVDVVEESSSNSVLSDVEVSPNLSPIKGRKRKKNPDSWKRSYQNKKRLSGKEYKNRSYSSCKNLW